MHRKHLAATGGAYSAPPDLLAGFNSRDRDKEWRKRKNRRG